MTSPDFGALENRRFGHTFLECNLEPEKSAFVSPSRAHFIRKDLRFKMIKCFLPKRYAEFRMAISIQLLYNLGEPFM